MIGVHKLLISKLAAIFLAFLLLAGDFSVHSSGKSKNPFATALKMYSDGDYKEAAEKLEIILNSQEAHVPGLRAKVLLVLGACYEKSGQGDKAKDLFRQLKGMLEQGVIDRVPAVDGVDLESLAAYREIFKDKSFFDFKEPVPVSEMMKKNVVHAPRKSIEEKERVKKRKKFPWLIAVGAVVIIGTLTILLFTQEDKPKFREVKWVHIPAGEFLMGDNFNEGETDELPVHAVVLDGYYISEQEIGIDQYNYFCEDTGRLQKLKQEVTSGDFLPAYQVSWENAKAFCDWLSARSGRNIHLPSEAQWEKAARGTYQYRYPWGNNEPDCHKAHYRDCTNPLFPIYANNSHPEGKSPYGVYHMAGNLKEWCQDWYSASYYAASPKNNPTGPLNGSLRVLRGGGYYSDALGIRCANREAADPKLHSDQVGLRIVMEEN